ncbi:MAG: hypothetical protein NT001_04645 [Candidatus Woesearchaeota archaeon]|nr:hypothetical protein [Candidatus Woesearchaeota archaeon]
MNFLGRFFAGMLFADTTHVERDLVQNYEKVLRSWYHYIDSFPDKERMLLSQSINFSELRNMISIELVDISGEEKSEEDLISDLQEVDHDYKVRKLHRIEETLYHAEKKYEYVYNLVRSIHYRLKNELHLLDKIAANSANYDKLITHLKNEIELERILVDKIKRIDEEQGAGKFDKLFKSLLTGKQVIINIESRKGKLFDAIQNKGSEEPNSVVYKWVDAVLAKVEDAISDAVSNGDIPCSPNADFEFVNSGFFEKMARDTIRSISPAGVSERTIEIFVHNFRETYNERGL